MRIENVSSYYIMFIRNILYTEQNCSRKEKNMSSEQVQEQRYNSANVYVSFTHETRKRQKGRERERESENPNMGFNMQGEWEKKNWQEIRIAL